MRTLVGLLAVAAIGCKGAAHPVSEPTCADASGKIARGMVKVREDIATAGIDPAPELALICADDAWDPEVVRCYAQAETPRDLRLCSDRLTTDQRVHARELQESLYRRASEVGDGRDGPTGIVACDEYIAVAALFDGCPRIPQAVKDAIRQSVDAMRSSWDQLGDDDASREAVEMGCTSAADALRQSLVSQGC